jgi:ATP-binding cassette subfamily B protein
MQSVEGEQFVEGNVYDYTVATRLFAYVLRYRQDALLSLVTLLAYTAANVSVPLLVMFGINWGINSGEVGRLHLIGLAFLGLTVLHCGANYLQFVAIAKVGQGILYSLRTEIFNHIQSLSPAFFHRMSVGRLMSRGQSDVQQLEEMFELVVTILADILSLVGIIVAMLMTDWKLGLVSLTIMPVLLFILAYWQRFARLSFIRIRRAIASVNGEYNQNITGIRVVQSLNRQR